MRSRFLLLALFLLGACRGDAPATYSLRDSAGIRIVEYGALPETDPWPLAPEPALVLGGLSEDPDQELYQALHALRLPDGRIAVANQGTEQIRFYGADGRHLRSVGREGGGPGEFRGLWGLIRLPGDSLAAWDWTAKRLTVYNNSGEFARVINAPAAEGFAPRLLGLLDSAHVAVAGGVQPGAIFAAGTGPWEDSVTILRVALADGAVTDSLGPFPADQRYAQVGDGSFWARRIVFGRQEQFSVATGLIHVGDDRSGEIRSYDSTGRLVRVLRTGITPGPVTDAALEGYRARYLESIDADRLPEERRRLEQLPVADRFPAFDELGADPLGRVWIRLFDPDAPDTRRWILFAPDGTTLHHLDLPARFQPLDAGRDWALFRTRDDLDVEQLLLFTGRREAEARRAP